MRAVIYEIDICISGFLPDDHVTIKTVGKPDIQHIAQVAGLEIQDRGQRGIVVLQRHEEIERVYDTIGGRKCPWLRDRSGATARAAAA